MSNELTKLIVVPVDGSAYSQKTLHYLSLLFGSSHPVRIQLLHILPTLPPIMRDEAKKNRETAKQLHHMEKRHKGIGDKILEEAKWMLKDQGLTDESILTTPIKKKVGIARDICHFVEDKQADAVAIGTRGRTKLEAFIVGETANKVLEISKVCPVWLVKGEVADRNVLIAMDNSENALRAVDHAGMVLAGTDSQVTVFYSKRKLGRFIPQEAIEETPDLEKLWMSTEGKAMASFMQRAESILLKAGIARDRVTVKIADGTRNVANDILKEARDSRCGTIVMGRRGLTGFKAYTMGSVSRKVIEEYRNMALWLVP